MANFDPRENPLPSVMPAYVWGTIRTVAAFVAGMVVSKGWFTAEQIAQIGGVAVMLLAWGASMWNARRNNKKLKDAINAPAGQAR